MTVGPYAVWKSRRLFDVSCLGHLARRHRLGCCERIVYRGIPGERRGEQLTDRRSETLELRNGCELHADIRHWLNRWMMRIGRIDRIERDLREGSGLQIRGVLVKRGPRPRRHVGPAVLRGDKLEVALPGGPGDELLRRIDFLGTGGNRERP